MKSKTVAELANDFPVAHSVDTAWFAVDENGNLAEFHSGEEGAVPVEWLEKKCEGQEVWESSRKGKLPFGHIDCRQTYWFNEDDDCKWGVYKRIHIPQRPLNVQDLPPSVMQTLEPQVLLVMPPEPKSA